MNKSTSFLVAGTGLALFYSLGWCQNWAVFETIRPDVCCLFENVAGCELAKIDRFQRKSVAVVELDSSPEIQALTGVRFGSYTLGVRFSCVIERLAAIFCSEYWKSIRDLVISKYAVMLRWGGREKSSRRCDCEAGCGSWPVIPESDIREDRFPLWMASNGGATMGSVKFDSRPPCVPIQVHFRSDSTDNIFHCSSLQIQFVNSIMDFSIDMRGASRKAVCGVVDPVSGCNYLLDLFRTTLGATFHSGILPPRKNDDSESQNKFDMSVRSRIPQLDPISFRFLPRSLEAVFYGVSEVVFIALSIMGILLLMGAV